MWGKNQPVITGHITRVRRKYARARGCHHRDLQAYMGVFFKKEVRTRSVRTSTSIIYNITYWEFSADEVLDHWLELGGYVTHPQK